MVVFTPNLDHLRRLDSDARFAEVYESADVLLPDGWPVVAMSRIAGEQCTDRVAGSDVVCELLAERVPCVFIGGDVGQEAASLQLISARYPSVSVGVVGLPMFNSVDDLDLTSVVEHLKNSTASVVLVCVGSPKQEYLCERLSRLAPGRRYLAVGASLDFVCGRVSRAPPWMRRVNLEWLHRLFSDPSRLWRRYGLCAFYLCAFLWANRADLKGR